MAGRPTDPGTATARGRLFGALTSAARLYPLLVVPTSVASSRPAAVRHGEFERDGCWRRAAAKRDERAGSADPQVFPPVLFVWFRAHEKLRPSRRAPLMRAGGWTGRHRAAEADGIFCGCGFGMAVTGAQQPAGRRRAALYCPALVMRQQRASFRTARTISSGLRFSICWRGGLLKDSPPASRFGAGADQRANPREC